MKKILFFVPAILLTAFYSIIIIGTGLSVSPMICVWIALFIASGVLMLKNKVWGGFVGLIPGCHLVYMSTINTWQIMNIELPMGILIIAYYLIFSGYLFAHRKKLAD